MTSITTQTITESETISFKNPQITVEDIIPTPGEPDIPLPPPSKNPVDILEVDKGTPDNHVPRDPRLIRLTGVHPFNVEPPLTALYKEGFLTSPELFYVRNHGPVPQVRDEDIPDWEISIEGLVEKPLVLNFREVLQKYDQITAPITLVCAGNRRKEQNTVRKSKGFSWGAAGLSTALFTGPMMADILRSAKPLRQAKYVCMEGADKLPNGFYGTSVKLNWAMDPNRGIMLAHKMNGEDLRPDHGRPLRAVVPGQIGGRSVKWLKKLILTDAPSDNWYHIYDNRVLPTMVTPDMSSQDPKWWTDERYAIYELNVNSVAVYPQHEEEIDLSTAGPTYTVKGYAYAGGGRRITKVEVSLDKGKSWRLSEIEYAEDKYRDFDGELFGGKVDMWWREASFCWSFWSLEVPVADLETSDAILVRAVDEALSAMPRDMYWSVLGMMNNPWFRVAITKQGNTLKFEHPTHPAKAGGWMERVKKTGGDLLNGNWGEKVEGEELVEPEPVKEINMKKDGVNRQINLQELKANSTSEKPWFIVNGEVYDGTGFLEGHPGGAISITSSAGLDVSEDFLAIHSETAKAMMPDYHIGTLDKTSLEALKSDSAAGSDEQRAVFLQSRAWAKATLTEKRDVSWDTRIFVFDLEHEKQTLGLPIGQHLMIKVQDPSNNEAVIRSYTPMSDTSLIGKMELLVKIYFPTERIPGGKMTMALDKLPLGSVIDCKGPTGRFEYLGNGRVSVSGKERQVRSFKMICGGTGITPVFQVLRAVMQDTQDPTTCVVLDGNRQEEDILCRSDLDAYVETDCRKCTVVHTLTKGSDTWTGRRGRISEDLLAEYAAPEEQSMVLVCGPGPMEKSAREILLAQGWAESDLHFF
ncbi:Eukaryotic molybdopterin oxidoreductase [Penicillium cf. griseofulvum]|uniref:Nitrate reductase n=1 Tax=Penicillium cf. griseofulvum TaxID=2972120 RepID=A0A9W9J360_9EURO|nr:Eukaryotic molybdopterin oxidoreductase [Penicillium cf. griseofulvum]KAJ5434121.1 Eukaryotic molybdopterin oxidoreductase [Penicillium cf. griseofulvum]